MWSTMAILVALAPNAYRHAPWPCGRLKCTGGGASRAAQTNSFNLRGIHANAGTMSRADRDYSSLIAQAVDALRINVRETRRTLDE